MAKLKTKLDVSFTVRLSRELDEQLEALAEQQGHTKTSLVRHLIEKNLRQKVEKDLTPIEAESSSALEGQT